MYLKRLEMQGFKSFADKTILEFRPGITGVIGPNGSGKSTLLKALTRLIRYQKGSVLLDGCDIQTMKPKALA